MQIKFCILIGPNFCLCTSFFYFFLPASSTPLFRPHLTVIASIQSVLDQYLDTKKVVNQHSFLLISDYIPGFRVSAFITLKILDSVFNFLNGT
jgi:hypothetical protein